VLREKLLLRPQGSLQIPEPMMEVSDAQVAPMRPISRLSPTSAGLVVAGATDSVVMSEPSFGSAYVGHTAVE